MSQNSSPLVTRYSSTLFTYHGSRFTVHGFSLITVHGIMKKIVLSTFGSFGDIHPYMALALELKRRGHRPVIATTEGYREKTDAAGLELHGVRPALPGIEESEEVRRMVVDFMDAKKGTERIFAWL